MSATRISARALICLSAALAALPPAGAQAAFSFGAAPGVRSESRVFTVPSDGCYVFRLEGDAGARLSVVDRMYGRIAEVSISGDVSDAEGRRARGTVLLESGDYKLELSKSRDTSASVSAFRFSSRDAPAGEAGVLRQLKLADEETISFTVHVSEADRRLRFFALGRSLGGAMLFRAGGWAAEGQAQSGTFEAEPGRPARWLEFSQEAEPGEYRVVCWGAEPLPWAADGPKDELFVSDGERRHDEIGLMELVLGPSGIEFLAVPGSVGFAQAVSRNSSAVKLAWAGADEPRLRFRAEAASDARGSAGSASLRLPGGSGWKRLAVSGKRGDRFELRFFPVASGDALAREIGGRAGGEVAIRALASVDGEDALPLTARAYLVDADGRNVVSSAVSAERVLSLSPASPLRLKGNLLSRGSLLVDVAERGKYAVLERDSKKASGRWTFFPIDGFSFNRRDAKTLRGGESVELEGGRYLLSIEPLVPGPLDALVARDGIDVKLGGMGLWNRESAPNGNELAWYGLLLPDRSSGRRTVLAMGEREGAAQGLSVRSVPLALSASPFSVLLEEGAAVRLRAELERPSFLRAGDRRLRVLVNGVPLNGAAAYPAGTYELVFSAADGKRLWACLEALPFAERAASESYASFKEGSSFWTEFERGETKRFLLRVDAPALYTVSTSGRLETRISLRSRMRPALASAASGGPGRNARVSAYLKAGEYLVEVGVSGASRGAAGLLLERRSLRTLSALRPDGRLRASAEADQALAVPVQIDAAGTWTVSSFGLGRSFGYRFEDALGWPVGEGGGAFSGELGAGAYRFISLDDPVPSRRVFTLARRPDGGGEGDPYAAAAAAAAKRFGAEFGKTYERSWRGSGPDLALLDLAAPATVSLSLSEDMVFKAILADGTIAAAGLGARRIDLDLPTGLASIQLSPLHENQDHAYTIRFDCPDLMEDRPRRIGPGSLIPVSLGRAGVWELETSGPQELEAALFEASGASYRLVSLSRSIEDDWNCLVSVPLQAGRYLLKVAAPGDPRLTEAPNPRRLNLSEGQSLVRLRFRADAAPVVRSGAFSYGAELGAEFAVVDFTAERAGPYRFSAESAEPAELYVEKAGRQIAYGKGEILVALAAGASYRVRFGQSGDGRSRVALSCAPLSFSEAAVGADDTLSARESAATVRDGKRMSRFLNRRGLFVAPGLDAPFLPSGEDPFIADGAWIARLDGKPLGSLALPKAAAGALALPLGKEGQRISVPVPDGSVALLRAASRGVEVSLTESGGAADRTGGVDWRAAFVAADRSVLALGGGERTVVVRDSRPEPDGRLVPVSAEIVPIVRRERLGQSGTRSFVLEPRGAVALEIDRFPARVSLERGLAAFDGGVRTARTADASDASGTFLFEEPSGTLHLVNPGNRAAVASVELLPRAADGAAAVSERAGWESVLPRAGRLSLLVDGSDPSLLVAASGAIRSFRFYDEDSGAAHPGERIESAAGILTAAPGRRGRLVLDVDAGLVKVFLSRRPALADAFAELPAGLSATPLGAGQAVSGRDPMKFSVIHGGPPSLLIASATGAGTLAVADPSGRVLAAAASADGQSLVAPVSSSGPHAVAVKPVKGQSRAGVVHAELVRPEAVERSGPLPERLASEGRPHAYRFTLGVQTLVGAGVRAERDGLSVRLYDAAFSPLGEGPALVRRLEPGDYYLIVSSETGTVRYRPVFFGIEGSRDAVPDEVAAQYLRNGEE